MTAVIDAAALLAALLEEPGADLVISIMRGSQMSAVNVSECCSRAVERGASASAVLTILRQFEIAVAPFDLTQAIDAADLRAPTKHVGASLGDRACLALARSVRLPMYTGDRRLAALDIGVDIRMIRG